MKYRKTVTAVCLLFLMSGCSESTDDKTKTTQNKDHIWKSQTEKLDRARDVESIITESLKKKQEQMDQQTK